MTDLAKLVVKLEAESARLQKDLDKANNKLGRFEKNAGRANKALKNMAKVGGAALVGLAGTLTILTKKSLDLADKIGKLSQSSGLSTETLSRLRYQSELTGSSFDEITKGVTRLQRSMYDAEQGLKTQSDAFDKLGVSVTDSDGNLRDTEETMLEVAERFSQMEDGAEKAALAQVLFGRAGSRMIPFLNSGKEGLKAMADEADALGITMSGELTAAAERTNDNMTRIKTAMEGVFLRVMAQALPRIEEFTKKLVAWSKESGNVERTMTGINNAMKVAATVWTVLSRALEVVGKKLGAAAAQTALIFEGDFKGAATVWKQSNIDAIDTVADGLADLQKTWDDTANNIEAQSSQTGKKLASPITEANNVVGMGVDVARTQISDWEKTLETAVKKSDQLAKKLQDRFDNLAAGSASSETSVLDVSIIELNAQKALDSGDIDGATKSIMRAYDILDQMKDAGSESSLVIEGLAQRLKAVGDQISERNLADIEARVLVDTDAVMQQLQQGNAALQKMLDENPLVQKLLIDQSQIPTAPQKVENGNNLQPVNLNLPNGETMQMYGDATGVDSWQRQFAREASKRGKR